MPAAGWQRMLELFEGAAERRGEERRRYLDEGCAGDAALRAELEAMLAASESSGSLLDAPLPLPARGAELEPESMVGTQLGPYRLVALLGEGGMGTVYEAEQREPLQRRVALKLIKLGMDTREVMARFAAERRTLARMAHPAIASVHDAGATPEGRPYFVMELVDGEPIDAWCDARRLGLRSRMELFLAVCAGVEHAHRRGVLHRDLKPSNVLVAERDGAPLPKIIDFGIARAVAADGGVTLGTGRGLLAGTPEYMSPEQASLAGDLDTRTDVYSLGVLLFELMAGTLPFDAERLRGRGPLELLRLRREEEPPAASRRLAALPPAEAGEIARRRGLDPGALRRRLQGELDWILARALARERDERYPSVADLAADVRRHLEGRAVLAGPPGRLYRLRKLVARHRVEAAAAALLLLALAGFTTAMTLQSRRLATALEVAEREGTTARRTADFLVHLLERTDPRLARGEEITVRQVLDEGAADLARELEGEPEVRAAVLETIGRTYTNLGEYERAGQQLEAALRLRRELGSGPVAEASVLQRLAELEFSRAEYGQARRLARRALALRLAALGERDPAVAETLDVLAVLERQDGEFAAAAELFERGLGIKVAALGPDHPSVADSWNHLGIVRRRQGDYPAAEEAYRRALALWRARWGEAHPDVHMGLNNLALLLHVEGKHGEARRLFDELLPLRRRLLGEAHPDTLLTEANLGKLLLDMRDPEAAERTYRHAIALARRGSAPPPQLASMLAEHGTALAGLGRFDAALAAAEEAWRIRSRLHPEGHYVVGASWLALGRIHAARGQPAAAEAAFAAAVGQYRRFLGDHPWTAEALVAQAGFLVASRRAAAAEPLLREAVTMMAARLPPGDRRLALARAGLGECLLRLRRDEEGVALLRESLAVLDDWETPEAADVRALLATLAPPAAPGPDGPATGGEARTPSP